MIVVVRFVATEYGGGGGKVVSGEGEPEYPESLSATKPINQNNIETIFYHI